MRINEQSFKLKRKKWIQQALLLSILSISGHAFAKAKPGLYIDVYGTDKISSEIVEERYGTELEKIYKLMVKNDLAPSGNDQIQIKKISHKIKAETEKLGDFVYFKPAIDRQFGSKDVYLTFDVVEKKDAQRLDGFLPAQIKSFSDPDNLIALWEGYSAIAYQKLISEKNGHVDHVHCSRFFCLFGFDEPELKEYKNIFYTLVEKNEDKLAAILHEDKNPEKRANVVYLLGSMKDGDKLIQILTPAMRDSDSLVRSRVMTVLGLAFDKLKKADFPIQNAINALDYPSVSDRNQALLLLTYLAKQPRYAVYLKEHAKNQLMIQLKMNKTLVHDQAYEVLMSMSGQKFGDRDYEAWENWLNTQKYT